MIDTKITITFDVNVAEATVNGKTYQANLEKIPNDSLVKIFAYGFQRLVNDRTGGSDKDDTAKDEIAQSMIARILSGEVAQRVARAGEPAINRYIRKVFRKIILAKKVEAFTSLDDTKARDAWLMEYFAKQSDDVRKAITDKAQAMLDADVKARKAEAALASELDLDL